MRGHYKINVRARGEGIAVDVAASSRHGILHGDLREGGAACEGFVAIVGHALGDSYPTKAAAAVEQTQVDHTDRCRQVERLQRCASLKGFIAEIPHGIGHAVDVLQAGAVLECPVVNLRDVGGQGHGHQVGAAHEGFTCQYVIVIFGAIVKACEVLQFFETTDLCVALEGRAEGGHGSRLVEGQLTIAVAVEVGDADGLDGRVVEVNLTDDGAEFLPVGGSAIDIFLAFGHEECGLGALGEGVLGDGDRLPPRGGDVLGHDRSLGLEGIVHRGYGAGDGEALQLCARESHGSDGLEAIRGQVELCQVRATHERLCSDRRHALRDVNGRQRRAALEGIVADGGDGAWQRDVVKV